MNLLRQARRQSLHDRRQAGMHPHQVWPLLGGIAGVIVGHALPDVPGLGDLAPQYPRRRGDVGAAVAGDALLEFETFSNISAWLKRGLARPAVQRGLLVPERTA